MVYSIGGAVGFYTGDIKTLLDDAKELKPTFLPAVPRLLNKIYDNVMAQVNKSAAKKILLEYAIKSKESGFKNHKHSTNGIADKVVFKKIRQNFGGRVNLIITGSAPVSGKVLNFIRATTGADVREGYGLTETAAAGTVSMYKDFTMDHVGTPFGCCEMKLVDIPDMGYLVKEGRGEVCIRGYNVFQGYYKDPVKTKEVIDSDGWFHTGDVGQWTSSGNLKLIDRKNHIFKLAQGEFVSPEKTEAVYIRCPLVEQVVVIGQRLKSCLVGIVVPNEASIKACCDASLKQLTMEELCRNQSIKTLVLETLTALGKKADLNSLEQIKEVYLHPELMTVENDLLTPTFKTKRPIVAKYFQKQIEGMYQKLP